ncbi:extracellular signal-regulated kinase 1-like isoform X2 [Halichondria panicea]|uniref:extracellular signal-regulated kinase 1-like isoform X2 n=1 Tax=Halichondria panicea TaxID=6063 RepID=UPI00312B5741
MHYNNLYSLSKYYYRSKIMNIASCVRAFMINYSQVPLSKLQLLLKLCQCKMSERGTQESRLMDYHRHRENTGMVTSPHGAIFLLAEEFKMKLQNQNGGDHTSSTVRGKNDHVERKSRSATYFVGSRGENLAASDKLEQEAGTSDHAQPSTFGVALRCTKLVMARDSQESYGANNELMQKLKQRRMIVNDEKRSREDPAVQNEKTVSKGIEEERQRSYGLESSENKSKTQPYENVLPLQKSVKPKVRERVLGYETTKEFISDAGCDDAPITRTGANHCDATVNKSTLSVQYTCTELEQLRQTHKQELEEKEKVYKKKRKNLEYKYMKMVDDLERNYQNKHDEQRKQLTEKFNKALAIQSAEALAEKARLLTSADQTQLDHQKQLVELQQENDGLNRKVKQCERNKQDILQHYQSEIQLLRFTNQQLETESNYKDELAPYILTWLPELGEQQGLGSYGSVYPIQLNGISCIAKRIHDIFLGKGRGERVNLREKRAAYEKFYHECVLLSRIRHPNIVQFMGVYYGPQRDYGKELTLVMERLYTNLYDCLHRYPNIEMWQKVSILLDISQGLLHLHSRGVVHRDLTAPNILLTRSFHAKIADLGVSKIIQVSGTKQTMAPGNPDYMPPEALTEIPMYGYALDIFSFGVIMLFVLNQEYPKPYEVPLKTVTGTVQRQEVQIQKRRKWIGKLSPDDPMKQLICRCLQDEPKRRPLSQYLNSTLIHFAQQFPKPFVDTIEMQRTLKPTTLPA